MLSVLLRMQMPLAIIYMALSEAIFTSVNEKPRVSGKHTKCQRDEVSKRRDEGTRL